MVSKGIRLTFIDVARSYAILLALFSHALYASGALTLMGEKSLFLQTFTRMATPMFVFMFGFMIEFVYVNKLRESKFENIRNRLLIRSFQCYLGYILISFGAVIGGYLSFSDFLGSAIFLRESRFGNILRIYSLLLLIMPLIIKIRVKYGIRVIIVSLILLFLSYRLISETIPLSFGIMSKPLHLLFGMGSLIGGPSVWHALSFVFAGMFLASSLSPEQKNKKKQYYSHSIILLIISFLLGAFIVGESSIVAWTKFSDSTYRIHNMPGYYLIGTFTSVSAILILSIIIGVRPVSNPINNMLELGKSSLFSFTLGNCLLNVTGPLATQFAPIIYISFFFIVTFLITMYHTKFPLYNQISAFLNFKTAPKPQWSRLYK